MPGPPSSINLLPANVRKALHGWLNDPGITQAEAAGRVNAMLAEFAPEHPGVSRHAVNRYDQKFRESTRQIRESREVASRMIADLGSKPGGELGNLLTEMIRVISFRVTAAIQGAALAEDAIPDILKQLKDLSLISRRVEAAAKISEEREREIRKQAALDTAAGIAERAVKEAGPDAGKRAWAERMREIAREMYGVELSDERPVRKGISKETADEIKRKILGLDVPRPA